MINSPSLLPIDPLVAIANPFAGPDNAAASWFHAHLTQPLVAVLRALSEPGSGTWIGIVLFVIALFFVWKRNWLSLVMLMVAVPGGMLLNELIKLLVQRPRPFLTGPFVDWSGYSFASGHTIGATLLYGQLLAFVLPVIKARHWRALTICLALLLVSMVGFSRIALGAHYLSDVLAAMFLGVLWLGFCLVGGRRIRRRSIPCDILEEKSAVLLPAEIPQDIQLR